MDASAFAFLVAAVSGWLNRQQQEIVAYLVEENRILRAQLGGHRLQLTDNERRRLAARGQPLGRRVLRQVVTIVTPDTLLRWHRRLIAQKWMCLPRTRSGVRGSRPASGRPRSSHLKRADRSCRRHQAVV